MDVETSNPTRSRAAIVAAAVVYLALAVRQTGFVRHNAVDVLYWDAWDLYDPLFRGLGWWASFDLQHGPHRQGFGGLLMRVTAGLTRWDARADAMAVSATLIVAAALGVRLAWRCGVRGWPLAAVPVIYLNARQYTMFVASANPAHGAVPVLLLTLYGLAWFIRRRATQLVLLVLLTAAAIFTGFGLFLGLVTPVVFGAELVIAGRSGGRRRSIAVAVALAGTAVAWAAFAVGYHPDPASDQFRFPADRPVEYLYFVGVLFANAVGVGAWQTGPGWGTIAVGLAVAVVGGWVCATSGRRAVRAGLSGDPAAVVVFFLSAFTLIFASQAAVGRTPQGWQSGAMPRYVTLWIPMGLAVLIQLGRSDQRSVRRLAVVFGAALAAGTLVLHEGDDLAVAGLRDGCLRWRAAYLTTGSQPAADRLARFQIYPRPDLAGRLRYLQQHQLNLFAPAAVTPPRTGGR